MPPQLHCNAARQKRSYAQDTPSPEPRVYVLADLGQSWSWNAYPKYGGGIGEMSSKEKSIQHQQRQCWMMRESPSTQDAQEPEIPAILYPRGGMRVCL